MTSLELDEWFEYHLCVFDKLRDYFEADPNRKVIWARTLRKVTLRGAKLATEDMLANSPPYWTQHVSRIIEFAKTHNGLEVPARKRKIDGQTVYQCAACLDSGHLLVFTPDAMEAMRGGHFGWREAHLVGNVACSCHWGQRISDGQKMVTYDPKKMVAAVCGNDKAAVAALAAFFGVPTPEYSAPVHKRPAQTAEALEGAGVALKSLGMLAGKLASGVLTAPPPRLEQGPPRVEDYDESEATVSEEPWTEDSPYPF
jgi:hypothetical protein